MAEAKKAKKKTTKKAVAKRSSSTTRVSKAASKAKTAPKAKKVAKPAKKAETKAKPKAKPAVKTKVKAKEETKTATKNEAQVETASKATLPEPDMQAMFDAGCHFGHQVAKWHPKMAPFIYGSEGGIHLFDLAKTAEQLSLACEAFYNLAKEGKKLLIVGTKRSAREIIKDAASKMGCFYISSRWMGGFLTNFNQLRQSIKRMNNIELGLESGKFDKYTKYERSKLDKEKSRLERFFIGLKEINNKPDCVFVIDPVKEKIAVQEASAEGIKIIALADSNADPRPIDLLIPANDDSAKSIQYIVDQLVSAYNAGKAARK